VKKLYLAATEKIESGQTYDIVELEKAIFLSNNPIVQEVVEQETEANDEKKRKRRNRWGDAPPETTSTEFVPIADTAVGVAAHVPSGENGESTDASGEIKKPRRSRWSTATDPSMPMTAPVAQPQMPIQISAEVMQQTIVLQMQLKTINEKLMTVAQDALREEMNPNRSPSPPPKYDSHGKRTNTRDVRMRETLTSQRTRTIEEMMRLNPLFQVFSRHCLVLHNLYRC
jgi:hypothetical protein